MGMSETKEQNDKTTAGERPKRTLALKRTEVTGQVRQSFSHGRTRQVVVEKTTKRTFVKPGSEAAKGVVPPVVPPPAVAARGSRARRLPSGPVPGNVKTPSGSAGTSNCCRRGCARFSRGPAGSPA